MGSALEFSQDGEIVVPHERHGQPVIAVRNVVVPSSLALLRDHGYFDRYSKSIDPSVLHRLSTNLAPGWVGLDLVEAHYFACDALNLSLEELERLGQSAGQRVRETFLVVPGTKNRAEAIDVWGTTNQLHRVWKRLYQGGSVQIAKLGPTERLVDFRGFSLNKYRYFRNAIVASIQGAHEAIGVRIESVKAVRYDPSTHELTVHVVWK